MAIKIETICPACDGHFAIVLEEGDAEFCPLCGTHIPEYFEDDEDGEE